MIYAPTSEDWKRCEEFAELVSPQFSVWARRHPTSLERMRTQQTVCKLGEIAVCEWFGGEADFSLHKKRSYSADVLCPDKKIHVKLQESSIAKRYGSSWIFMLKDPVVSSPADDEFIALVTYQEKQRVVQLDWFGSAARLVGKYKPTKRQNNDIKCAIYKEDLID